MKEELRKTGIDIIGDVSWGTHLIQFYLTKKDLMDILVPYFKAGLENNEFCLWVTSKSLSEKEAGKAMRKAVSDFDQYLDSGQMEIVPHTKWYVKNGKFNSKRVLNGWNEKMNQARDKGLGGLRAAGDTGWLEKKDCRKFIDYEIEFNRTISQYPCIAICTYPLGHWGASEILDLIGNHKSALIKRRGKWEFIESHRLERVEETLRKRGEEALCFERQRFQTLSEYAPIGLMMFDQEGIFRYLNPKFKELFGYDLTDIPDRRTWYRKAYPDPTYRHQVISAWKNDSERFKQGEKTPKIFTVTCKDGTQKIINFLPVQLETGEFFTACEDITERKRAEVKLSETNVRLHMLQQATALVHSTLNLEKVFKQIADRFVYSLGFTSAIIFELNEKKDCFKVKAFSTKKWLIPQIEKIIGFSFNDYSFSFHPGLNSTIKGVMEGNIVVAKTAAEVGYPLINKTACSLLQKLGGTKNYIAVSFLINNEVAGGMLITSPREEISEEELEIVRVFAFEASHAIENANLLKQTKQAEEEVKRLAQENAIVAEIGRIVSSTLDMKEIYEHFAEEVRKLIPFDRISVSIFDLGNWTSTLPYVHGVEIEDRKQNSVFSLTGTINEEIVRRRSGVLIQIENESELAGRFPHLARHLRLGIRSVMTAPLISKDQVIGALHFRSLKPNAYTESDLRLAERVGNQIAGAIASAQLFIERNQAEEALREFESKHRDLVENSMVGVYLIQDNVFKYVNSRFAEIHGYEVEEIVDRIGIKDTILLEDLPIVEGDISQRMKSESVPGHLEFRIVTKSQEIKNVEVFGTNTIYQGRPAIIGTLLDVTERKQTEEALRLSEQRTGILNQIANIFLTVPDDEIYAEVLAVVLQAMKSKFGFFGYIGGNGDFIIPSLTREIWSECKVQGKSIVFPSDTWGESLWGKAIREKKTFYSDGPFRTPEGHIPIDHFLTVPIVFGKETIGLLSVANREGGYTEEDKELQESIANFISPILNARLQRDRQGWERKRAEELLLESEARFRQLFDEAPIGYHEIDIKGKISRVNRTELNMLGYSVEEMLGKPVWEFVADPDSQRAVMNKLAGVNPPGYLFERTYRRKDGTKVPIMIMERILVNENGQISGIRSTIQDITERKRAEELLRKSEEKYRTLFEESKDAIFITTPDGKFLDINPTGVKLLGYSSKEDLLKADIPEEFYFHPEDRERLERTLAEQGFVKDYELTLRRKNGETLIVLETAIAVRDEQGNIVAYRGIMRDVTEKKNLEQQYLQSQKMEAIGILAGGVAHDFNNLLMVIQGNVELGLMKIDRSDPLYEGLMKVREGTKRASDLTQQLLSFSRRRVLHPRILNVADLIGDLSKMLSRVIGEDIELKIEFGLNLGHIYVDPNALDQVLMNLVVNARNAMPQGGVLYIQAQNVQLDEGFCHRYPEVTPGEYIQISVIDTGTGMDENILQRIFEPFFTTREQGTGLGLAMVYGIVKQHNGHIIVSSQLEKGSRFDIYLPLRRESLVHEVLESENVLPRGRETILLAEDEKEVRELLKLFLESLGYTVLPACDGEEALEIFSTLRDQIDLIILDAVMPKISGPQVLEQIRTLSPNLNCLLLTGYSEEIIQRYFDQELNIPVLRKPITFHELGRKVREALDY